ncbi:hypothetical protein ACWEQU_29825 [Streptomyces nodosus]
MSRRHEKAAARAFEAARAAERARRLLRTTWWHRVWGTAAVLLGAAAVTATAVLLASVPGALEDVRAYRAARPCPSPVAPAADCLRTVPATVRGKTIQEGHRNPRYKLFLDGPRGVPAELEMDGPDPLLSKLHKGDTVTLTRWRGYTTAVSEGGVTQGSADTPDGEPEALTALALALLAVGLYGMYAGAVAARHASRHAREGLPVRIESLGIATFWAAVAALPAVMVGDRTGPVGVVVSWLALLLLILLIVLRVERKSRGRHSRPYVRARRNRA